MHLKLRPLLEKLRGFPRLSVAGLLVELRSLVDLW